MTSVRREFTHYDDLTMFISVNHCLETIHYYSVVYISLVPKPFPGMCNFCAKDMPTTLRVCRLCRLQQLLRGPSICLATLASNVSGPQELQVCWKSSLIAMIDILNVCMTFTILWKCICKSSGRPYCIQSIIQVISVKLQKLRSLVPWRGTRWQWICGCVSIYF